MNSFNMSLPTDHPPVKTGQIGVLFVNLGTPDDTSTASVRRYLKQFLSDDRVVEIPRLIWWPILNGIILNVRPRKSAEAYKKVWMTEQNESPLRYYTRELASKVNDSLDDVTVGYAMRYGNPSIHSQMDKLKSEGCDRLLIVPLYPQYSGTTTASVVDEVYRYLRQARWQPTVRIAHPWYRHPSYISALETQVRQHIEQCARKPDKILLSFHGLPADLLTKGDPYHCHCVVTRRLLAESLSVPEEDVLISFQSRFGPAKWLQPYTVDELERLPKEGVKNLLILTPGFAVDCIETLEEIAIEGAEIFRDAGGEMCEVLPCLNDSQEAVSLMAELTRSELAGWT